MSVSALSAGAYTTLLYVMISIMMDCTPQKVAIATQLQTDIVRGGGEMQYVNSQKAKLNY